MPRRSPSRRSTDAHAIHLEAALLDDLPALVELEEAAFPGDRISARSWRALMRSPSATITVARGGGCIAGCAVLLQRAGSATARLYSIAVAEHARGRGVSAALLEDAIRRMHDAGAAVLRLETRVDNLAAQRLFASRGFVAHGCKAAYYEDGEDALLFRRPLRDIGDPVATDRRGRPHRGASTWHPIL